MKHRVLEGVAHIVLHHPITTLVVCLAIGAVALFGALHLEINSNQIDLLDPELRPIQELKKITQMTGGTGFLMLALKGDDKERLKAVTEDLAARIGALDDVRSVTYKQDAHFIRDHIAMLLEPEDLDEVRKRAKKIIRQEIAKQNPFAIQLVEPKPVDFDDLVEKYRSVGKKGIDDDYYISRDLKEQEAERPEIAGRYASRYMMLLLIKPVGESTDLEFTRSLLGKLDRLIADYTKQNDKGATLLEGYGAPVEGATITYGYTGGYKLNLDDYDTIKESLVPTSAIAFALILVVLFLFVRRASFIIILQVALLYGVLVTFGLAKPLVGRLNVITAVLGCILQGLGIDYGIHLLYRLREEYTLTRDLEESIRMAVIHSGSACAATVLTTASAFFVMRLSEFRGFSDFGLLAGVGVIIIALATYVMVPVLFLCVSRVFPRFPERLLAAEKPGRHAARIRALDERRFPVPGLIIAVTIGLTVFFGWHARAVSFDYDARSLMVPQQPSIVLQQEINDRYQISSDPVAVYAGTFEEYEKLFRTLHGGTRSPHALDRERYPTIDAVISLLTFLPTDEQQQANAKTLVRMRKDLEKVDRDKLPEEDRDKYDRYKALLEVKPFGVEEVPASYVDQFRAVPAVREKFPGWLTFIYPKVSLWDGRDLLEFNDDVGVIEAKDGQKFYATGMAILFAKLADIVLTDGKRLTLITFGLVFLLILINFRRLGGALVALLPLAVGIGWMLGLMELTGIKLNFINMVILTLIFGYGIDTGIHIYHRFHETGSVMRAVRMTGGAVLASMLTAIAGWGALAFADHRGLQSMGQLACLGIASALVVSLTLMPAILQVVADRRARREAAAEAKA